MFISVQLKSYIHEFKVDTSEAAKKNLSEIREMIAAKKLLNDEEFKFRKAEKGEEVAKESEEETTASSVMDNKGVIYTVVTSTAVPKGEESAADATATPAAEGGAKKADEASAKMEAILKATRGAPEWQLQAKSYLLADDKEFQKQFGAAVQNLAGTVAGSTVDLKTLQDACLWVMDTNQAPVAATIKPNGQIETAHSLTLRDDVTLGDLIRQRQISLVIRGSTDAGAYLTTQTRDSYKNGFNSLMTSISGGMSRPSQEVGVALSYSEENSKETLAQKSERSFHLAALHTFPKFEISLNDDQIVLSTNALSRIEAIINSSIGDAEKRNKLRILTDQIGICVPRTYTIGGKLCSTQTESTSKSADVVKEAHQKAFGAAVSAASLDKSGSAALGYRDGKTSSDQSAWLKQIAELNIEAIGGNTSLLRDPTAWLKSLDDYRSWTLIGYSDYAPIWNFLPRSLKEEFIRLIDLDGWRKETLDSLQENLNRVKVKKAIDDAKKKDADKLKESYEHLAKIEFGISGLPGSSKLGDKQYKQTHAFFRPKSWKIWQGDYSNNAYEDPVLTESDIGQGKVISWMKFENKPSDTGAFKITSGGLGSNELRLHVRGRELGDYDWTLSMEVVPSSSLSPSQEAVSRDDFMLRVLHSSLF